MGTGNELRQQIVKNSHSSLEGGQLGVITTTKRIQGSFYWPQLREDVQEFVKAYDVCQRCKPQHLPVPGLLQPIHIPENAWETITMDFIEGLPRSSGKEVILVVVDKLTKYGHFISLIHPYTATTIAQLVLDNVVRLHGPPKAIISDRDTIFVSSFWRELFKSMGTQVKLSTAYHPGTHKPMDNQKGSTNVWKCT